MSEVYFIEKNKNQFDFDNESKELLNKYPEFLEECENLAIKMHFGEEKSITHLDPDLVEPIYDYLNKNSKKCSLIDCNVLYKGKRSIKSTHKELAKENGFDFGDIVIADGEKGEDEVEIEVNEKNFDKVKIGRKVMDYDSIFSLAHFTGHEATGYGAAIKNIGMGLGSKSGKLGMHEAFNLEVNREKCQACGRCIDECPSGAIDYYEGKSKIDKEKCIGCGICIAVCPFEAIQIPWEDSSSLRLQERIAETALGVLKEKENSLFMNVLFDITPECDCINQKQDCLIEDQGVLISDDIVSIDQASLDLIGTENLKHDIDFEAQVEYAEEIGLGERNYDLVEIN